MRSDLRVVKMKFRKVLFFFFEGNSPKGAGEIGISIGSDTIFEYICSFSAEDITLINLATVTDITNNLTLILTRI